MEKFESVCKLKLNLSESIVNEWIERITSQYKNRFYHNLDMLDKKLKVIDEEFQNNESLKNTLIIASIFQYFHFDVKVDKSIENCEEFKAFVDDTGIKDPVLVNSVMQMLRDETEIDDNDNESIKTFKDLDLIILGSSAEEYDNYTKGVEMEFSSNEDAYKRDRLKMIKTLLKIPFIYSNQQLRDKFENIARRNIENEIQKLES